MNIAAIIGVSKYENLPELPFCKNDANNMFELLDSTHKYDDVLIVKDHTKSSDVRVQLFDFFEKHKGDDVFEAFIYFSGHGYYHGDAMFCCSDFNKQHPNITSISNSEIDDLLREISPQVAVKVIDACQSGSPYIKGIVDGFEKALKVSGLKSFLCMSSSQKDQYSYGTSDESEFTMHWINAASMKRSGRILYREIQASVADAFIGNLKQTPFFVSQGTITETFGTVTPDMINISEKRQKQKNEFGKKEESSQAVKNKVKELDSKYVSYDAVCMALNKSREMLIQYDIVNGYIGKYYKKIIEDSLTIDMIPGVKDVAEFADKNGWMHKYFIDIKYGSKNTLQDKRDRSLVEIAASILLEDSKVADSIVTTEKLPYEVLKIELNTDHESLSDFLIYIGVVHSKREVCLLTTVGLAFNKGWHNEKTELLAVEWQYSHLSWKSIIESPDILWKSAMNLCEELVNMTWRNILDEID